VTAPVLAAPEAFQLYRPRAGHPDWSQLAGEARALADRLRPGLETPRRGLAEARRRAASYATFAGNYAINRRRARAGREDLLPLYFIWTLLRDCNFSCDYCDDHRGRKYPDLPRAGTLDTARALRLLEVMRTRTPSVYFAGGEPTLRKDLPELTRAARDLDYYPIIINSNGSAFDRLLARPAWRTWLADIDVIVVSLDGVHEERMGSLWKYRRPRDVMRNLLLLRELAAEMRVKLMVNAVIRPGAVADARDVLDLANDLDIWFCPVPLNVGPSVSRPLVDDPEYQELVEVVLERKRAGYRITGSQRMNQRLLTSEPLDCRNTLKPHIDHDGRLFWPCKASVAVDPLSVDVLAFEHVDQVWEHARARIDPTGFQRRCGARCNWAQNYTTDEYAHGLAHPWSLLGEVRRFAA